jgi:TRAP-type mannitol/chloroaromatic compound transport system permease large subunit
MQIGYLSPPFDAAMFYLKGVAPPEVGRGDLHRAVGSFMGLQGGGLVIGTIFAQTAGWFPNLSFGA